MKSRILIPSPGPFVRADLYSNGQEDFSSGKKEKRITLCSPNKIKMDYIKKEGSKQMMCWFKPDAAPNSWSMGWTLGLTTRIKQGLECEIDDGQD